MNPPSFPAPTTGAQPWAGLKVVERDGLCSSYATRLWAALGAEVVVLEPPGGHAYRHLPPFAPGTGEPEGSLWWAFLAQNKRSVVIEPGSDTEQALLAAADVVFDEPAPPVVAPSPRHDRQVYVAITPFGLRGPRANWRGSDLVAWAAAGLSYVTGFPDRPPVALSSMNFASHVTAMQALGAAMMALFARKQTGRGQLVDLSMQQANAALHPEVGVPLVLDDAVHRGRSGNRRAVSRPWGLYPCTDGYASVIIVQPAHWMNMAAWLVEVTGVEALADPAFNDMAVRWEAAEFIDAMTEQLTSEMSKQDLFVEGQRRNIPITPVNTVADLSRDPHLEASGFWVDADHPVIGPHRSPGAPFSGGPDWWSWTRAPLLGEHTDEVLASWTAWS